MSDRVVFYEPPADPQDYRVEQDTVEIPDQPDTPDPVTDPVDPVDPVDQPDPVDPVDQVVGDQPVDEIPYHPAPEIVVHASFTGGDPRFMRVRDVSIRIPVLDDRPADYTPVVRGCLAELSKLGTLTGYETVLTGTGENLRIEGASS